MLETVMVLALTGVLTGAATLCVNLAVYYFSPIRDMVVIAFVGHKIIGCLVSLSLLLDNYRA